MAAMPFEAVPGRAMPPWICSCQRGRIAAILPAGPGLQVTKPTSWTAAAHHSCRIPARRSAPVRDREDSLNERPTVASAVAAWAQALGRDFVSTDADALARFERTTFAAARRVSAVLRPGNAEEVAACVRLANVHRVALYPVSRGRNWGFGSAVPASDGCAILDLSRLDRISGHDERLGTLTVEPGVTFEQVYRFLRERKSAFYLPPIGGPRLASVIGNAVERGDTTGPHADRFASVCSLDVVLPSGELLRTGFSRFAGSALADRGAPGPLIEGLFAQSNLGIVVGATVALVPRPACIQLVQCQIGPVERVAAFIEALRPLILRRAVDPAFTVWNAYKLLARQGRYPWTVTKGETPLRLPRINWFASAALHAPGAAFAAAQRDLIAAALQPVTEGLDVAEAAVGSGPDDELAMLLDEPSDNNVRSLYWRKKTATPTDLDPDRDRCGAHWICVALPFEGRVAAEALELSQTMLLDAGFEPIVGFHTHTARMLCAYIVLVYDREIPGEDERAIRCHDAVLDALAARGIHPLGIQSMARMIAGDPAHAALLRALKDTLDPNGVVAPGRYDGKAP
ncbi:MAG: FAD-binding oxidoreductase [Alphaproteobacteria bacterium]|nr:FAD-binding oxidoreductase [Alphaproteobacteria bacterium]